MTNINEVAKKAGTSITTVSRVINNIGNVKTETRDKVLKAIEELQYKPLLREDNVKETRNIALVVPNIENPFFGKLAKALSKVAYSKDYNISLIDVGESRKDCNSIIELIDKRVDGLIYGSSYRSDEVIYKAQEINMPIVVMDRENRNSEIYTVTINNDHSGYIATEHLIELGHKKIAYIGGPESMQISSQRENGYIRALEKSGLIYDKSLIAYGNFQMSSGYSSMKELLERNSDITGIIAANDLMAIGAINYLNQNGISVPKEMSVVGFDDIELASSISPMLTTISYPIERMAELAIQYIIKQLIEKENRAEIVTLFSKLEKRGSCDIPYLKNNPL